MELDIYFRRSKSGIEIRGALMKFLFLLINTLLLFSACAKSKIKNEKVELPKKDWKIAHVMDCGANSKASRCLMGDQKLGIATLFNPFERTTCTVERIRTIQYKVHEDDYGPNTPYEGEVTELSSGNNCPTAYTLFAVLDYEIKNIETVPEAPIDQDEQKNIIKDINLNEFSKKLVEKEKEERYIQWEDYSPQFEEKGFKSFAGGLNILKFCTASSPPYCFNAFNFKKNYAQGSHICSQESYPFKIDGNILIYSRSHCCECDVWDSDELYLFDKDNPEPFKLIFSGYTP